MGRGRRSLRRRSSLRRCRPMDRSHCRWSRATASRRTLSSSATAHCTAAVFPTEYVRADGWLIASPQEGAAPPVRARNRLRASAWWCCRSQKTQSPGCRTGRGVVFTAKGERAADGDGGWRRQECACGRPLPARLRFPPSGCVMVLIIVRTSAMEYQLRLPVSASIKCFITTTEDGGQVKIKPLHINHNVMGLRVRQMSPYFRRYSRRPPPQHWSPSRDARLFTIRYSGSRASMASRGDGRHDARLWLSGTGTNDFVVVRALR